MFVDVYMYRHVYVYIHVYCLLPSSLLPLVYVVYAQSKPAYFPTPFGALNRCEGVAGLPLRQGKLKLHAKERRNHRNNSAP